MGSVQRRKSLAHLSNLKQERNESIKKYLARFGKEVAQIEDASDVAVIAAFTNGLQSGRLSFDLRRERPKTYEEMMEIAGDYALAEEEKEEVAQGGSYEEILSVVEDKGLAKYPRQQSANARRDTTKYCRFHKDHGHETSKCFQLCDHIESLIRDGHLKDFALKGDKHGGCQDSRQGNVQERKSPRRNSPNATINTIFGGPHARRSFNPERSAAIKEDVSKLLAARSIREVKYPEWVANVVLVKKKNKQWRMCIDFTDLNKACPKDSFSLPRIDQLVDVTAGHETLSFMDAYSGYNQIKMHKPDEEKTAFTTDQGLYCYTVMPFGLKNAGATYQRLVNKMFARQIGRNMEVYVDDMLTKSITADRHTDDLRETFDVLVKYGMKLNPAKCVFGVPSGRFLGYQVHQRGIEVNPEKIQALAKMVSPRTLKDVQRLTGCLASLSRFIAKSTDQCLPFFKALKKGKGIKWNEDCERAFQALKDYLGRASLLSKSETGETLYMYLSVSEVATSSVLVRQEEGIQKPIYYTSKALLPAETRTAIKAQAVADFVAEFTEPSIEVARMMVEQNKKIFKWQLRIDGSSNTHGSGAGVVVSTPEGDSVECALCFDFKATNNQAEYEALIAGLKVCTVLGADEVEIFSDSQVVVNQVLDEYQARDESMITYLELAKELLERFKEYRIVHVPREENEQADALAKLASAIINIWPKSISMIRLLQPSIVKSKEVGAVFGERNSWITPIKEYLVNDVLPSDPLEAKRLKYRATRYSVLNGELYKRGYSRALQRCVGPEEVEGILRSIHSGNCGNHAGGVSLAHKTLRQGFYWPTLFADAKRVAARCEVCQKIANNIRHPSELLQSITSPWPFAIFGIPNTIITDNGTQFDGRKFRELCDKYGINNYYASPAHPQTNGQTEAVNKIIKHNLKAKLATKKGSWADKLPQVLWAYRTTERGSIGETPYSMAYGAEAVIPMETSFSSPRVQLFQPELNIDMLKCGLDELEERRERAQIRNTAYQQKVARYYNSHVRERRFSLGDLVLKRVNPGTRDKAAGSLADKWEGPYQITGIAGHGAYRITREGFGELPRPCNAQYFKIYYP
ncbi:hypothetical protein LWI29_014859 [Acer saccharum]|uniref:Uncharacterized protein n=1 Tax=Acer saccharum TaxID=4024 RepID=A0AA39UIC9_ACESA|nr:hypothetical protein LWI29_014859 [Acer saccharum]